MQLERKPGKDRSYKVVLNITPQTHVRTTKGDRILFRIPRDQLRPAGLKRLIRIERYNQYKIDLSAEAKRVNFSMQPYGQSITFFVPVPRSWTKKKKRYFHLEYHQSTPDLDNFIKAMKDSLLNEDKHLAHYELAKRWVDNETGWIEVYSFEPESHAVESP